MQGDTIPQDTIPTTPAAAVEVVEESSPVVDADTIPGNTSSTVSDPQPKIIYYQSDRDDDYRQSSVRYRERKGNRVKTLAGTMNHSGGFRSDFLQIDVLQ